MIKCEFYEEDWDVDVENSYYEHVKVEYSTPKMFVYANVWVYYYEDERGRLVLSDESFPYNFEDLQFSRYDENAEETESLSDEEALKGMTKEEFAEFEKNMVQFFDHI